MTNMNIGKVHKTSEIIFIVIITLAIIWNFYPQPHWPDWSSYIFWVALIFVVVLNIFTSQKVKYSEQESKGFSLYWGAYLLTLITFLSIFRGEPSSGYTFFDPITWIVLIPIFYTKWKRDQKKK